MVTISESQRYTTYSPVVSTTNFPVNFPLFDNDDLFVSVDDVQTTDYTVTATYVEGISTNAVVVMNSGVIGDVLIAGMRAPARTDQFITGGSLPISGFNYSLNRLEIEAQEARRDIDRSHKAPFGEAGGVFSAADIGLAQGYAEEAKGYRDDANAAASDAEAAAAAAASAAAGILPYPYQSVAAASAAVILSIVKRIRTLFHTPNFAVPNSLAGGAHYRRISFASLTGVQTQAYFRSADRFMPDGTTDLTNGGYWIIDETDIDWRMFGVQCDGSDETVKCQAMLNFCMQQTGRVGVMTGTVYVSKLTIATGLNGGVYQSEECTIMGIGATALSAVFEVQDPNINMTGRLVINAQRNSNYVCGFRLFNATATQGGYFRDIVVNGALTGFIIGSTAYPAALVSETTFENPQTYSCPVAMEVMGGETYVTISNPQLSADSFGGNAGWAAHEKIGLRNWGATVMVQGGEIIDTTDTNGKIFHFVPIDRGGGRVEWGTLNVVSTTIETAAPLCVIDNLGLAINNAASGRRGAVYLTNLIGYHSQDLVGFIYVPPAYQDFLVIDNPNFWKSGAVRTQPNIYAVGSPCEITVNGPFGPGFPSGLGAIQGGRVNFSRREIIRAIGLNGQSFPSASFTVAKFQTEDTNGDKPRFAASYSPSTGIFTVPDGGLEDVVVTASLRMTGATTGVARLVVNSSEVLRVAPFQGSSNFTHSLGTLTAGATLYVDLQPSANDTGIASAPLSVLSISAKRGET